MSTVEDRTSKLFADAVREHAVYIAEQYEQDGSADEYLKILLDESAEIAYKERGDD